MARYFINIILWIFCVLLILSCVYGVYMVAHMLLYEGIVNTIEHLVKQECLK